jgi:hypothetical protein
MIYGFANQAGRFLFEFYIQPWWKKRHRKLMKLKQKVLIKK